MVDLKICIIKQKKQKKVKAAVYREFPKTSGLNCWGKFCKSVIDRVSLFQ